MIRDLGSLNGTFVNRRRIESAVLEDDDEVQIGKYRMTFLRHEHDRRTTPTPARLHTIGAVCERLRERVPRHLDLEDPLPRGSGAAPAAPHARRLPPLRRGGRRAADDDPAAAARRVPAAARDQGRARRAAAPRAKRRARPALREQRSELDLAELCERAGITPEFARQLEEYGLVTPRIEAGERLYRESDADIARRLRRIARHGLDARHLRAFRTAAGRQSALLEQLVAPGCARATRSAGGRRSTISRRSPASRQELAQLLLVRDLREVAER